MLSVAPWVTEIGSVSSTIRRGTKWADLIAGDVIELANQPDVNDDAAPDVVGLATVVQDPWTGEMHDLPPDLLADNNDPKCRDWHALVGQLVEVYDDFDPAEVVTHVRFKFNGPGATA